ncbi:MAG: hypothetical protein ACRDY7_06000 [Acidimicrobiia bacterium]
MSSADCYGVALYCDLDAMSELAGQLRSIRDSLDDPDAHVDMYDCRLGSGRLEEEVNDFISGWRDGRKEIRGELEKCAGQVDGSIAAYQQTEDKLAAAARGEPAA